MFANSRKGRGYPTGRYGRISFCSLSLAFLLFQYIQQESKGNDYLLSGETHPKAHARSSKSQESQLSQPYNDGGLCIQAIQRLQESKLLAV